MYPKSSSTVLMVALIQLKSRRKKDGDGNLAIHFPSPRFNNLILSFGQLWVCLDKLTSPAQTRGNFRVPLRTRNGRSALLVRRESRLCLILGVSFPIAGKDLALLDSKILTPTPTPRRPRSGYRPNPTTFPSH